MSVPLEIGSSCSRLLLQPELLLAASSRLLGWKWTRPEEVGRRVLPSERFAASSGDVGRGPTFHKASPQGTRGRAGGRLSTSGLPEEEPRGRGGEVTARQHDGLPAVSSACPPSRSYPGPLPAASRDGKGA